MIWLLGGYMWLYVHRPFEIYPSLGSLQIERGYMLLMLTAWLVYPNKGLSFSRMHVAIGLFLVALLGSWSGSPYANKPGCWETCDNCLKVLVFYGILVTTVRDEKGLRLLVLLFLAATGLYLAHSFYEFVCGRYQYRMGVSRMMGVDVTYADPNAFAATLLYTLPLLLPFWNEGPRRVPRWVIVGYAALACYSIFRTGSRGGLMGLIFAGVMIAVVGAKNRVQALALCAGLGLVAAVGLTVAAPDDLQRRYLTIVDSAAGPENAQRSAEGRLFGFFEGIRLWTRSPLFGNGPASFALATGEGFQAHNLYGQVLSELGLVGTLALGLMVAFFFANWRLAYRLRSGPDDFAYQVARSVGFIVILLLVMGWGGHNLFRYQWQWFAAFQAIAVHVLWQRAEARRYAPLPAYRPAYAGAFA
ncbi:MAG: O-antigen ligase family protein [Gemmataceae bacterium]